jgi:predicted nucleic acid-binding protein
MTHPRIYAPPPTPAEIAVDQVEAWLESPSLTLLSESEGYWPDLRMALHEGRIVGPQVHDARVAALCRLHGVRELWTVDRDFGGFHGSRPETRSSVDAAVTRLPSSQVVRTSRRRTRR